MAKVWEREETGMRGAAKTSGDDFMHLFSVSMRGGMMGWVNERVGTYFSLRSLWNIPGATPLNHMHIHFCLDDTQNHESRGWTSWHIEDLFQSITLEHRFLQAGLCSGIWRQYIFSERHSILIPACSVGMVPLINGRARFSGAGLLFLSNYCLLSYSAVSSFPMMLLMFSLKRVFTLLGSEASFIRGGRSPSPLPWKKIRHPPKIMQWS